MCKLQTGTHPRSWQYIYNDKTHIRRTNSEIVALLCTLKATKLYILRYRQSAEQSWPRVDG